MTLYTLALAGLGYFAASAVLIETADQGGWLSRFGGQALFIFALGVFRFGFVANALVKARPQK